MRILFIVHSTEHSGSAISFLNLIAGLKAKRVELAVAGPTPNAFFLTKLKELGISYYSVTIAESVYPSRRERKYLDIFLDLFRILNLARRKEKSYRDISKVTNVVKPDIIHTNVGTVHEGFSVAKRKCIPHVWHIREYQDLDFGWRFFPSKGKFVNELNKSYVITISKNLLTYFDLQNSRKARVIYNGICSSDNTYFDWPKEKFFLCATRISREKGIDDVIKSFAKYYHNHKDYRLVILGDGDKDYVQLLLNLAESLACGNAIYWKGYKTNVIDYMRNATGLIVASHYEGFGRMTAEACFAGCIVLGHNSGGTKEILEQTGGILFNTVEELVEGMHVVSSLTEDSYRSVAIKAQNKARKLYSIESNVDSVYQLYESILTRTTLH